jgi:sugar/nucleoside kinase (ribokinase family)
MLGIVNTVAARANLVMPGVGEGRLLTGHEDPEAVAETYLRAGASEVVIKLGAAGALARNSEGETAHSRSFAITPIDSVGAGDGFAAGYLAGLLTGANLQERLDQAAATGALVTTRRGDLTAMPSRAEVDELLIGPAPRSTLLA